MGGVTIGDLLNSAGITWGGFMGGFNLSIENPNGTTVAPQHNLEYHGSKGDRLHRASLVVRVLASVATYSRPARECC